MHSPQRPPGPSEATTKAGAPARVPGVSKSYTNLTSWAFLSPALDATGPASADSLSLLQGQPSLPLLPSHQQLDILNTCPPQCGNLQATTPPPPPSFKGQPVRVLPTAGGLFKSTPTWLLSLPPSSQPPLVTEPNKNLSALFY